MTKQDIFAALKRNVFYVMDGLDDLQVTLDGNLRDLGANSIDRATIVSQSLADLGVTMSLVQTVQARNLRELVELIHQHCDPARP
jgi:polyketide biosynthesis acyl carrier protein